MHNMSMFKYSIDIKQILIENNCAYKYICICPVRTLALAAAVKPKASQQRYKDKKNEAQTAR